jgi:plasmid maintenance system antidote protein VapI
VISFVPRSLNPLAFLSLPPPSPSTFPALSSLLNGKAGLSGEMALRIEKAFGVRMDTLMRMQSAYDIAQTRMREKEIRVRRIYRTADAHP